MAPINYPPLEAIKAPTCDVPSVRHPENGLFEKQCLPLNDPHNKLHAVFHLNAILPDLKSTSDWTPLNKQVSTKKAKTCY